MRKELEGLSFAPLLEDRNKSWKTAAFSQFLREGIWVAPDGVTYMGRCIRTDRYRYVEWNKHGESEVVARELYDLEVDPQENTNIAGHSANRPTISRLAQSLKAGWKKALPQTGLTP